MQDTQSPENDFIRGRRLTDKESLVFEEWISSEDFYDLYKDIKPAKRKSDVKSDEDKLIFISKGCS